MSNLALKQCENQLVFPKKAAVFALRRSQELVLMAVGRDSAKWRIKSTQVQSNGRIL